MDQMYDKLNLAVLDYFMVIALVVMVVIADIQSYTRDILQL